MPGIDEIDSFHQSGDVGPDYRRDHAAP